MVLLNIMTSEVILETYWLKYFISYVLLVWILLIGRYPQVSGIFYAFDPTKPPNSRIDPRIVKVQDEYLDLERVISKALFWGFKTELFSNFIHYLKTYTLATNVFLQTVDETLKTCPIAVSKTSNFNY